MGSDPMPPSESPARSDNSTLQGWPAWESSLNSDSHSESPWSRKIILSLDGGGVRGYASLHVLKRLMDEVKRMEKNPPISDSVQDIRLPRFCSASYDWNMDDQRNDAIPEEWRKEFLPHHYVDYVVGTSTGGLSAIMLGRLQMDVQQALDNYNDVGCSVFQRSRYLKRLGSMGSRFSSRLMDAALQRTTQQDVIQQVCAVNGTINIKNRDVKARADKVLMRTESSDVARTVVVAHGGIKVMKTFLFRSYDHTAPQFRSDPNEKLSEHHNPGPASNVPLWVAGRATSAAPGFFSALEYEGAVYQDGAVANHNNPVKLAFTEVEQMHWRHRPKLIISIGTGQRSDRERKTGLFHTVIPHNITNMFDAFKTLKKLLLNSHTQHEDFESSINDKNNGLRNDDPLRIEYFRFDVPARGVLPGLEEELSDIKLGEWKGDNGGTTKHQIETIVNKYMDSETVANRLEECAKILVDTRNARAKTERWERKALHVVYTCGQIEEETLRACQAPPFDSRGGLRRHAMSDHGFALQVPCKRLNNENAADWTCFSDHCGELRVSAFDDEAAFLKHLRDVHKHTHPRVMPIEKLEKWLSRCRSIKKPTVSRHPTAN